MNSQKNYEPDKLDRKFVLGIFRVFSAIYPDAWVRRYPTEREIEIGVEEWRKALYGLQPAEINKGLEYCRWKLKWPPTPAEFIEHATIDRRTGALVPYSNRISGRVMDKEEVLAGIRELIDGLKK